MSLISITIMDSHERFNEYTLNDFVWNKQFREWTLSPNDNSNAFWNNWLSAHPEKKALVNAAKETILCLNIEEPILSAESIDEVVQQTLKQIELEEIDGRTQNRLSFFAHRKYTKIGVAAFLILALGTSMAIWFENLSQRRSVYRDLVQSSNEDLLEKDNRSDKVMTVDLEDGSKIVLEKDARISYPASFGKLDNRKVFLSGDASFDVAKNSAKPFLVYANGLITKVIGTQFKIHSSERNKKVSVEVISGMVSVYSYISKPSTEETDGKKLNSLILTANQKADYSGEDKTLMAAIVENPLIVSTPKTGFLFEDTPVDTVFKSIAKAYGIDILCDERSYAGRTFTSRLSSETLFEKLNIICKALSARYEVIDGKIVIYNNTAAK